jgi:RNA polymerase sigma factor (sigma-70 family)
MTQMNGYTSRLLNQLRQGENSARSELINHAHNRLLHLARKMLRNYPGVRRWEETEDISQDAMVRLFNALATWTPPSSKRFWNLLAMEIRRVLIDLARHYQGPEGLGANHHSDRVRRELDARGNAPEPCSGCGEEPQTLLEWTEFHERVAALPEPERFVFDLLWYRGITQEEAANELGISLRTVRRRWHRAQLSLGRAVPGTRA